MKALSGLIFLVFFLSLITGSIIYLSRRFQLYFALDSAKPLYLLFIALVIFMIGGIISLSNAKGAMANFTYSAAAITMGFLLYLLLSVIIIDLVSLSGLVPPQIRGTAAISLAVLVSAYSIYNATHLKLKEIHIPVKGLQKEIRAMHLTDIHIGHFWGIKSFQKIINKTNEQNPDVVFITGDLFDGKIRLSKENLSPLKQLNVPVYFVEGNHDGYTGATTIKQMLREMDIQVLENDLVSWNGLQIVGLNHMLADENSANMHGVMNGKTVRSVLSEINIDADKPSVLLHHSPDGIKYAAQAGIDLYLAGHTHGGQLFPVNYIGNLLFEINKGLRKIDKTHVYVSQGAGTFGPPMRLGTNSEITLVKLMPAK